VLLAFSITALSVVGKMKSKSSTARPLDDVKEKRTFRQAAKEWAVNRWAEMTWATPCLLSWIVPTDLIFERVRSRSYAVLSLQYICYEFIFKALHAPRWLWGQQMPILYLDCIRDTGFDQPSSFTADLRTCNKGILSGPVWEIMIHALWFVGDIVLMSFVNNPHRCKLWGLAPLMRFFSSSLSYMSLDKDVHSHPSELKAMGYNPSQIVTHYSCLIFEIEGFVLVVLCLRIMLMECKSYEKFHSKALEYTTGLLSKKAGRRGVNTIHLLEAYDRLRCWCTNVSSAPLCALAATLEDEMCERNRPKRSTIPGLKGDLLFLWSQTNDAVKSTLKRSSGTDSISIAPTLIGNADDNESKSSFTMQTPISLKSSRSAAYQYRPLIVWVSVFLSLTPMVVYCVWCDSFMKSLRVSIEKNSQALQQVWTLMIAAVGILLQGVQSPLSPDKVTHPARALMESSPRQLGMINAKWVTQELMKFDFAVFARDLHTSANTAGIIATVLVFAQQSWVLWKWPLVQRDVSTGKVKQDPSWHEEHYHPCSVAYFPGCMLGSAISSFLMLYWLLFILFMILQYSLVFGPLLIFLVQSAVVIIVMNVVVKTVFLNMIVGKRILTKDGHVTNWVGFAWYITLVLPMSIVVGWVFALLRLVFVMVRFMFCVGRLDTTLFPEALVSFDTGFISYRSVLLLTHRCNNPLWHAFADKVLQWQHIPAPQEKKEAETEEKREDEVHPNKAAVRARWSLAYTLVRNPQLMRDRRAAPKSERTTNPGTVTPVPSRVKPMDTE